MPENFSPHSYRTEIENALEYAANIVEDVKAKRTIDWGYMALLQQSLTKMLKQATLEDRFDGPNWIRTKEQMPEDGQEVLVYHVLGDRSGAPMTMDIAHWINGKWIYPWDRGGINPTPWLVTHWHPLPSIPATHLPDAPHK